MSDKTIKKSKAELYAMLAEAIRNTQPQPVDTQLEPVCSVRPALKRKTQPTRPAPGRAAKIKRVRR